MTPDPSSGKTPDESNTSRDRAPSSTASDQGHGLTRELRRLRRALRCTNRRLAEVAASNELLRHELAERAGRERQRYVSVKRAAEITGWSEKTVREKLKRGELAGRKGDTQQSMWIVDVTSLERQAG
jgi:hypothetical protein